MMHNCVHNLSSQAFTQLCIIVQHNMCPRVIKAWCKTYVLKKCAVRDLLEKICASGICVITQLETHHVKHSSGSSELDPEHLELYLLRPSCMCVSCQHAGTSMKILCKKVGGHLISGC